MRPFLIALALLLAACGASLKTHALVALTTGEAIDQVGAALQQSSHDDWLAAGGSSADPAHVAQLKARYEPLRAQYDVVRSAQTDYVDAIKSADAQGDDSLAEVAAQKLLGLWSQLTALGAQFGVKVTSPPDQLVKLTADGGAP